MLPASDVNSLELFFRHDTSPLSAGCPPVHTYGSVEALRT